MVAEQQSAIGQIVVARGCSAVMHAWVLSNHLAVHVILVCDAWSLLRNSSACNYCMVLDGCSAVMWLFDECAAVMHQILVLDQCTAEALHANLIV